MDKELITAISVVIVTACMVTWALLARNANRTQVDEQIVASHVIETPMIETAPKARAPVVEVPATRPAPKLEIISEPDKKRPEPPAIPKSKSNAQAPVKLTEPLAREALALVGADPAAEAAWFQAINDPSFSDNFRKDLIEDLNDQGFENRGQLTENDLILVERRLAIIESLAPEAMDETNAAAFAEAYKDLSNMLAREAGN